ncbi:MAG: hypothetical protein O2909_11320, partial [Chloroflexi bacterium]|nr:hypothetical protein [Chloroflexota bacterium]
MGIGLKLGLGFLVVAVLVAVVGFIGIQSIHRTRITAALVADVDNLLLRVTEKDSMVSSAVSTQDLDSFEPLKVRAEQLNVEIHTVIADLQQTDELDDELDFVSFLANEASLDVVHSQLMANHDELLTRRDLFSETPLLEQSMRFQIEAKLLEVGDPDIIDDFRSMSYHSKEALYQYQDQEHFEEWFAATNKVAEGLEVNRVGYTSEQQRVLLNQLQVYLDTARILGQITLREREI